MSPHVVLAEALPRDLWVQKRTTISEWELLIEHYDAVTHIRSHVIVGNNRYSGKQFTRYDRTYTTYAMRPTSTGRRMLRIFVKHQNRTGVNGGVRDATLDNASMPLSGETAAAVEKMIARVAGHVVQATVREGLLKYIYPILSEMVPEQAVLRPLNIASGMASAFRSTNAQDLVLQLFGKRRYRKDLTRAVASAPLWAIRLAYAVRTEVEVDWLVDLLRAAGPRNTAVIPQFSMSGVRAIIAAIPKHRRRALLLQARLADKKTDTRLIYDSVRMAAQVKSAGLYTMDLIAACRSWPQIHEALVELSIATQVSLESKKSARIALNPISTALNNTSAAGYQIQAARSFEDLIRWGKLLRNCIGSYLKLAQSGESNLFVLIRGGKPVGNMELSSTGELVQLVGFANAPLSLAEYAEMTRHVAATTATVSLRPDTQVLAA